MPSVYVAESEVNRTEPLDMARRLSFVMPRAFRIRR